MRTQVQEREKKRRQRERRKSGEWYVLVDIESVIIPALVLHHTASIGIEWLHEML